MAHRTMALANNGHFFFLQYIFGQKHRLAYADKCEKVHDFPCSGINEQTFCSAMKCILLVIQIYQKNFQVK